MCDIILEKEHNIPYSYAYYLQAALGLDSNVPIIVIEWFEPRSHVISMWNIIVRVSVVLN